MGRYAIRLTHTDRNQRQSVQVTDDYYGLMQKHQINGDAFSGEIESIFLSSSGRRSHFFFSANIKKYLYGFDRDGRSGQLPVYGVKGMMPEISRASNYVELMSCDQEELRDNGFEENIFQASYIAEEETLDIRTAEDLESIGRIRIEQDMGYYSEQFHGLAIRLLEQIWAELEKNPATLIIIVMPDAENASLPLLREMYRLMPFKLRNSMGFITNVGDKDLEQISVGSLPIHIATQDSETVSYGGQYRFSVTHIHAERLTETAADLAETRSRLLCELDERIENDGIACTRILDYAENEVMRRKNISSVSFREYEEILKLAEGFVPWWEDGSIDSPEKLVKICKDQSWLWEDEKSRGTAIWFLHTKILNNNDLCYKIAKLATDDNISGKEELLLYLETELGLGNWLSAIEAAAKEFDKKITRHAEQETALWRSRYDELKSDSEKKQKDLSMSLTAREDEISEWKGKYERLRYNRRERNQTDAPLAEELKQQNVKSEESWDYSDGSPDEGSLYGQQGSSPTLLERIPRRFIIPAAIAVVLLVASFSYALGENSGSGDNVGKIADLNKRIENLQEENSELKGKIYMYESEKPTDDEDGGSDTLDEDDSEDREDMEDEDDTKTSTENTMGSDAFVSSSNTAESRNTDSSSYTADARNAETGSFTAGLSWTGSGSADAGRAGTIER